MVLVVLEMKLTNCCFRRNNLMILYDYEICKMSSSKGYVISINTLDLVISYSWF